MFSSLTPVNVSPGIAAGVLAAMGILVFFGMVVQKEFVGARSGSDRVKVLGQVLIIGAAPLLIVLILVVIKNILQMAR
ncbi:MAG: hypothetical protein IH586_23005 [Anaerolineaceae bacterium]|nr:hypothetical protein [Anaerolineaceae bacterium]